MSKTTGTEYVEVTERPGDPASDEQLHRMQHRYQWAAGFGTGKDILEIACGAGQGLGLLSAAARSLVAGDVSRPLLRLARGHYHSRVPFVELDAQKLPFPSASFDVIVMFEAIYYLRSVPTFAAECRRVLRQGGKLLVTTANKDIFDFNPSPHAHHYLGAVELHRTLTEAGFKVELFGMTAVDQLSLRQRILRPAKWVASKLNVIPGSIRGRRMLRRLMFGPLKPLPPEVVPGNEEIDPLGSVSPDRPNRRYKVLYCAAST